MPEETISRLIKKGVERPEDLLEIALENTKIIAVNLKLPGRRVPGEINPYRFLTTLPLKIGAKVAVCLHSTMGTMKYYETTDCEEEASALARDPIIKSSNFEHSNLVEITPLVVTAPRVLINLGAAKCVENRDPRMTRLKNTTALKMRN